MPSSYLSFCQGKQLYSTFPTIPYCKHCPNAIRASKLYSQNLINGKEPCISLSYYMGHTFSQNLGVPGSEHWKKPGMRSTSNGQYSFVTHFESGS